MVVSSYVVLVTTTKLGMKEVEICGGGGGGGGGAAPRDLGGG